MDGLLTRRGPGIQKSLRMQGVRPLWRGDWIAAVRRPARPLLEEPRCLRNFQEPGVARGRGNGSVLVGQPAGLHGTRPLGHWRLMAPYDAQHPPQHRQGYGTPGGNQAKQGHCKAHGIPPLRWLLPALPGSDHWPLPMIQINLPSPGPVPGYGVAPGGAIQWIRMRRPGAAGPSRHRRGRQRSGLPACRCRP